MPELSKSIIHKQHHQLIQHQDLLRLRQYDKTPICLLAAEAAVIVDGVAEVAAIAEAAVEEAVVETSANVEGQLPVEGTEVAVAAAAEVEVVFSKVLQRYSWPDNLYHRPVQR